MATAITHSAPSAACLSSGECIGYLEGRDGPPSAHAVQNHLDQCERCRVMVAETARATFADGLSSGTAVRTLADGEKLGGRYQIRRFVARGGMGEVYEASDLALGESVALKTLSPTMLDQGDATERLIAEVRLARKVTHPNVCRILEFGLHRRQGNSVEVIPFLTMEMLDGETLGSRLRRVGRLEPEHAASVLKDIAAGLRAVHDAGIVHRDFKTENVFLVRGDGGRERPVVMDFGLARALEVNRGSGASSARAIIGTVAYMAPEQVEGQVPTPAFDVYAMGIVAFEMLTGRLPFAGDSPLAVATLRLRQEPPRPSSLRPGLPAAWDAVIGRCLARDPRRRFGSVDQVIAALEQALSAKGALGWVVRAPRAMAAAVVVLAVSIGVATMAHRQPAGVPVAPRSAVAAHAVVIDPAAPAAMEWALDAPRTSAAPDLAAGDRGQTLRGPEARRARGARDRQRPAKRSRPTTDAPAVARPSSAVPAGSAEGDDDFIDPFPAPAPSSPAH